MKIKMMTTGPPSGLQHTNNENGVLRGSALLVSFAFIHSDSPLAANTARCGDRSTAIQRNGGRNGGAYRWRWGGGEERRSQGARGEVVK